MKVGGKTQRQRRCDVRAKFIQKDALAGFEGERGLLTQDRGQPSQGTEPLREPPEGRT